MVGGWDGASWWEGEGRLGVKTTESGTGGRGRFALNGPLES